MDRNSIEESYSKIANEYSDNFYDELEYKPLDRYLLNVFCKKLRLKSKVCDVGCGPGHVSRFVKDEGIDIFGIDLSEGMVKKAKEMNPDIEFIEGDMLELKIDKNSLAGAILYYSIVHFSIKEVEKVLMDLWSKLENDGLLFIAFHVGNEKLHVDNLFDKEVELDYMFFNTDEIVEILKKHNYRIIEAITRYPYENYEYNSKKGYILCEKIT